MTANPFHYEHEMKFFFQTVAGAAFVLLVVTFGNGWALLLSGDFGLLSPFLILAIVIAAPVTWFFRCESALTARRSPLGGGWACAAAMVVLTTIALLFLQVPSSIAFWISVDEFASLTATAPVCQDNCEGKPLGQFVGCFYVDRYGADGAGGVFFRTATCIDIIDVVSFGFAYRPHLEGCPFGHAKYETVQLFGDWYWFAVSNDW